MVLQGKATYNESLRVEVFMLLNLCVNAEPVHGLFDGAVVIGYLGSGHWIHEMVRAIEASLNKRPR